MAYQKIKGIELYYEQQGVGDDLILIGGLSADHQVWKSTLRLFSPHFRVTIFDNRGAGQSSAPDFPYTTELMAQDVLGLMEALSISRAYIVGHSMGGCITQQLLLMAPDRIKKAVIMCSRAQPSTLANMILSMRSKLQAAAVSEELLAEYVMPFLFSEAFLSVPGQVKGFIQWTMQNAHPQSAAAFNNQFHAVLTHDVSEKLDQITTPTLVIAGEEDILMPYQAAEIVAKTLKNGSFLKISGCAHMPHVEQSALFAKAVLEFFSLASPQI